MIFPLRLKGVGRKFGKLGNETCETRFFQCQHKCIWKCEVIWNPVQSSALAAAVVRNVTSFMRANKVISRFYIDIIAEQLLGNFKIQPNTTLKQLVMKIAQKLEFFWALF